MPAEPVRPRSFPDPAVTEEDRALLAGVRAGESGAFATVFTRYFATLCVFASRLTGSRSAGEEVVEDVFVHMWEMRDRLDLRSNLKGYLFKAVRNRALNQTRNQRTALEAIAGLSPDAPAPGMAESPPTADEELHVAELAGAVVAAVESLPPRTRQVFLMHREQGLTCAQIGATLGITPKTVENLLGRAFKALRERLSPFLTA